jgi:hypothetical protein
MHVADGDHEYRWHDDWADLPPAENGRTHGVAVAGDGSVVVFRQADPAVLRFDPDGTLRDSWGDFGGAHGLTLIGRGGSERLWLTDQDSAEVVETTLAGERVTELDPPDHPAYGDGSFVPTWVAVGEERGDGDRWLADGYGESLVHRYDADGEYRESLDGSDGAGRFDCPHAVWIDRREGRGGERGDLYVADRGNERIQVFDADGEFRHTLGVGDLNSPCSFAAAPDGTLVVPELQARVTLLDADGDPVAHLGEHPEALEDDDWPNLPDERLQEGRFNSPHDAAVDRDGNIYVAEWIVGGRVTKLEPV